MVTYLVGMLLAEYIVIKLYSKLVPKISFPFKHAYQFWKQVYGISQIACKIGAVLLCSIRTQPLLTVAVQQMARHQGY